MSGYSRRQLANQSDVYAAIEGILSELYKEEDDPRHYYGLPCRDFDMSLLWTCSHIDGKSPLRTSENVFLPTWSWSSFNGGLTRLPGDYDHHFCSTLLTWATYDNAGSEDNRLRLKSLKFPSRPLIRTETGRYPKDMEFDDPYWCPQPYLALACQHGSIEAVSTNVVPWDSAASFASLRSTLQARYPTYSEFWDKIRALRGLQPIGSGSDALSLLEKDIDGSVHHEGLKPGPLVSRAQVARFHIGRHHPEDCISRVKRLCHHCDILGEAMLSCGYIYPDEPRISPSLSAESVSVVDVMAFSISVKEFAGVEKAIGVQENRQQLERLVRDKDEEITFFDNTGEALIPCPVVNVMLIGRRSSGMSYRMGVGWILMRSWAKAERRFETVVLK